MKTYSPEIEASVLVGFAAFTRIGGRYGFLLRRATSAVAWATLGFTVFGVYPTLLGQTLTSGETVNGSISSIGKDNRYEINLTQGEPYFLVARDAAGVNNFEPVLRLYRSNGSLVDSANTSGFSEWMAVISGTAPVSGTYSLAVYDSGNNSTGDYDVTLTKVIGPQAPDPDSGVLSSGATRQGSIEPWGDIDRFEINMTQGEPYFVVVRAPAGVNNFEPVLRLYRSSGSLVDSANTSGFSEWMAVVSGTAPVSGTYYLLIHDYSFNWSGKYDVTLTKVLGPQAPDSDSGVMTSGATRQGSIDPWGDIDRFEINLTQGEPYFLVVRDSKGVNEFEPAVRLYRSNGTLVDSANTSGFSDAMAVVSGTAPVSGTYYVLIHDYGFNWTGQYDVTLTKVLGPQAPDPDSGVLTSGATRQGSVEPWGDIDRYEINLTQGEPYFLVVRDSAGVNEFEPAVRLYRSNGTLVDSANTSGFSDWMGVISGTAPVSGTYYVLIHDYGFNWTGKYDVTLTKVLGPQAPDPDSGVLTSGATRQGSIDPWGDIDRYEINLTQGESYSVVATNPRETGNFEPALRLYRPNGALEDSANTSGFSESTAVMSGTAAASGTYYLVISDYGFNWTADYFLSFGRISGSTGTAKLVGRILNRANGNALPGGIVQVWRDGMLQRIAPTDFGGNFTVSNLPAGSYEIRVHWPRFLPGIRSGIIVTSGQTTTVNLEIDEAPSQAVSPVFAIGNRIKATGDLNIRAAPPQLADIGDQHAGVHGTVMSSPMAGTAGGYTGNWYEIDWDAGSDGWSAESLISLAPTAGDVLPPNFLSPFYTTDNIFWQSGFAPSLTSPPNPQLGAALGNCTWYAHGRVRQLGYNTTQLNAMRGNANQWDDAARANGILVEITPAVHSIAQSDTMSGLGHVAVVESVNGDGTITITESSYTSDSSSTWNVLWRHRTVSPAMFQNFIRVTMESGSAVRKLAASRDGANIKIEWTGTGTLESADAVTGPWSPVPSAKSPFTASTTGNRKFYRLRQ